MKHYFFLVFVFMNLNLFGQKDSNYVDVKKNIGGVVISTVPTQIPLLEFPVVLEKYFNNKSIGLITSYRFSRKNNANVSSLYFGGFEASNFFNPLFSAFSIGCFAKFLEFNQNKHFFEVDLLYRHWWYDKKVHNDLLGVYYLGLKSRKMDVFTLKLLVGNNYFYKINENNKLAVNVYMGFGMKNQLENEKVFYAENKYYQYNDFQILPALFLGLRVGIANIK